MMNVVNSVTTRNRNTSPRIVALGLSVSWYAAIRRALEQRGHAAKVSLVQALDWEDLAKETRLRPGSLCAIGCDEKKLAIACRQVAGVANNPYSAKFVSVAQPEFRKNESLIRQFGFADCFWSVVQTPRLVKMAERLANCAPSNSQTIEQTVWSRLPWKMAQDPNQNPDVIK